MGRLKPPMPQRGDFSFGTGHLDHRRVPSAREVINRTLPILAQRTRKVSGKTVRSIVAVVYNTLHEYWSQKGIELDERAIDVLRQDGSLGAWWSEYWSRKTWYS